MVVSHPNPDVAALVETIETVFVYAGSDPLVPVGDGRAASTGRERRNERD